MRVIVGHFLLTLLALKAPQTLKVSECSHWWVVGITTSQVRQSDVRVADKRPQTMCVTPNEQQHSHGALG